MPNKFFVDAYPCDFRVFSLTLGSFGACRQVASTCLKRLPKTALEFKWKSQRYKLMAFRGELPHDVLSNLAVPKCLGGLIFPPSVLLVSPNDIRFGQSPLPWRQFGKCAQWHPLHTVNDPSKTCHKLALACMPIALRVASESKIGCKYIHAFWHFNLPGSYYSESMNFSWHPRNAACFNNASSSILPRSPTPA